MDTPGLLQEPWSSTKLWKKLSKRDQRCAPFTLLSLLHSPPLHSSWLACEIHYMNKFNVIDHMGSGLVTMDSQIPANFRIYALPLSVNLKAGLTAAYDILYRVEPAIMPSESLPWNKVWGTSPSVTSRVTCVLDTHDATKLPEACKYSLADIPSATLRDDMSMCAGLQKIWVKRLQGLMLQHGCSWLGEPLELLCEQMLQ